MKWFLALLLLGAVAYAIVSVPPRTAARLTARGLRAGWDWFASVASEAIQPESPSGTPARQLSRKAQAAVPQRRASRDGIVPQPPKETLQPGDRAALNTLLAQPIRSDSHR
jgi:hypothetical protein